MRFFDRELDEFPSGTWEDGICCGSASVNKDGSLTVDCTIFVHSDDGRSWETVRRIRLDKCRATP